MDRVSVVIPAYNAERTLRTTLNSVLAQTHSALEVIIVDDGSTDGTESIVKEIKENINQGNIRYIKRENGGISAARNTGLRACTGEYITLLDHDDLWDPDKVERQLERIKQARADLVFSYPRALKLDGKLIDPPLEELQFDTLAHALIKRNLLYVSTILFHRSVLERVGFLDESLRYCEDWDWALRMAPLLQMVYMPECQVTRRDQPTSFSIVYSGRYQYYVKLFQKHVGSIELAMREEFRKNMGNKCYTDAMKLLKAGRREQARAAYREALKLRGMLIFRAHKLAARYLASFW